MYYVYKSIHIENCSTEGAAVAARHLPTHHPPACHSPETLPKPTPPAPPVESPSLCRRERVLVMPNTMTWGPSPLPRTAIKGFIYSPDMVVIRGLLGPCGHFHPRNALFVSVFFSWSSFLSLLLLLSSSWTSLWSSKRICLSSVTLPMNFSER